MYNDRPVIGILANYNYTTHKYRVSYSLNYWLKYNKAYTVYINPNSSHKDIREIYNACDGIVIPGGDDVPIDTNIVYRTFLYIMYLWHKNKKPILGICLGLQFMTTYFSGMWWENIHSVVENINTINGEDVGNMCSLKIINHQSFLVDIKKNYLEKKNQYFVHHFAIPISIYNKALAYKFTLLSTTTHNNIEFVSSLYSEDDIFLTQWHPEKPIKELTSEIMPNKKEAIFIGNKLARFFINKCINNSNTSKLILKIYDVDNLKLFHNGNNNISSIEYVL